MLPWQQHFEGHVLLKFKFLTSLICRFNWIAMLGIEYFDNLEHYCFEKYLIFFSFKLLALNAFNVVQSFADLFPTFSNVNLLGNPSRSDKIQKTWPPSWIIRERLHTTYDVINHVQFNLGSKKYSKIEF